MRVFTRMRQLLSDNTELRLSIAEIQQQVDKVAKQQDGHGKNIDLLFEYIDRLQEKIEAPTPMERKLIGYKIGRGGKRGAVESAHSFLPWAEKIRAYHSV